MKIVFTDHAIERYVERYVPHLDFETARDLLIIGAEDAVRLKAKTIHGHTQWKVGIALVVTKRNEGRDEDIAVTILPMRTGPRQGVPDEELAMALELVEERGSIALQPVLTLPIPEVPPVKLPEQQEVSALRIKTEGRPAKQGAYRSTTAKVQVSTGVATHIALIEKAIETARSKTLRHIVGRQREHAKAKIALRIAMRALRGVDDVEAALEAIAAIDPGLVSDAFIHTGPSLIEREAAE